MFGRCTDNTSPFVKPKAIGSCFIKFPFTKEVQKFLDAHKMIFVIEQNRDGQLSKLLISETEVDRKKIKSIRLYNGIPIFPKDIVDKIQIEINAGQAA